jgi:D-3-phosphoglycerate dehydrogenase/C-terminal binding protein
MKILYLNYPLPSDGLEQATFGSGATLAMYPIGGQPTAQEMAEADGIITGSANHDVGPVDQYPNCKIILRLGVGYDNLDLRAWAARGVPVCNVPDYGTSEVADHAVTLMVSLARGIVHYQERLRSDPVGNWGWSPAPPLMRRLRDNTFGIIGFGRIGMAAARRAAGFGMDIVFYDPHLPNGVELGFGCRRVHSVNELMAQSDAVSLHAPSTEETRHIINAQSLAAAKQDLILINTARGPLVDLDALHSGRIGGAALDVFPSEPPSPLPKLLAAWRDREAWLENRLLVTPHAAFFSPPANLDIRRKAAECLLVYLRDNRLTNCVNLDLLKRNR